MTLDQNESFEGRGLRAPGREEGEIAISDSAGDQQAAGPKTGSLRVIFGGIEIGEWAIGPVIKPCLLGAFTC